MLRLEHDWVWDSWPLRDGPDWHLFFLYAPRSLGDPDQRHVHARIGHAVSTDLHRWDRLPDVGGPGDPPAPDAVACWTGSTTRAPDGTWHTFYTGLSRAPGTGHEVQQVVRASSADGLTWRKDPAMAPVRADARWYAVAGDDPDWPDEHWRDPWVVADADGRGWTLLVTARARPLDHPDPHDRGVVGHAWSPDLTHWEVRPPLSAPGAGFGQLEVPQLVEVRGRHHLLFSCRPPELAGWRRAGVRDAGHWLVPDVVAGGPYDVAAARVLTGQERYAGHVVVDDAGRPLLLACHDTGPDGSFVGVVAAPQRLDAFPARDRPGDAVTPS